MEEEIFASNVTSLDKRGLERLRKHTFVKINIISYLIIPAVSIAVGAVYGWLVDLYWGIGIMCAGVLFGVFYPLIVKLSLKKNANNKLISERRLINRYDFYKDYFVVQTKSLDDSTDQPIGMSRVAYRDVTKVVIDPDFMFIFIDNVQCFIVSNSGMMDGNVTDVKDTLRLFCPNIIEKKSKRKV